MVVDQKTYPVWQAPDKSRKVNLQGEQGDVLPKQEAQAGPGSGHGHNVPWIAAVCSIERGGSACAVQRARPAWAPSIVPKGQRQLVMSRQLMAATTAGAPCTRSKADVEEY